MTLGVRALGSCLAALLVAGQSAAQSSDLESAEALWRIGSDLERKPVPPPSKRAWTFDVQLDLALTAAGNEPRTQLGFDAVELPRLGTVYDFRSGELLQPMASRVYPTAQLVLDAEWEIADWLLVRGLFATGQVRQGSTLDPPLDGITIGGSPAVDALTRLDFVRELAAVVGPSAATLELGRFRTALADGLVYDGFALGGRARVDLQRLTALPARAELAAAGISDRLDRFQSNPLLALRLSHPLSPFEELGLFAALVWDRDGSMSDVMRSALAQRALAAPAVLNALFANERGRGRVLYAGADAELLLASGLMLRSALALAVGDFTIAVGGAFGGQQRSVAIDLLGGAANAELRYDLGGSFELVGYAFVLSGDGPPLQGNTYHAFISPAPYWVWTGLFFSGGLNQSLFVDRAALGGIHGHGVVGGGPGLSCTSRPVSFDLRAIWLQALAAPPPAPWGGDGRSYGLELDARAQWDLLTWVDLGVELDVLLPANYFPRSQLAYRALALASFSYEN